MNNATAYPFPDEYAPPKVKEEDIYGLKAAKAMYYSKARHGYRMFGVDTNYQALVELAQGRQSTDNIRKMFGYFDDKGASSSDNGSLAYIDIQVLNFATDYVNRAVAKLQKFKYDISLSAVDIASVDEAKEYSSKIKALYALKGFYEAVKIDPATIVPDIDLSSLPDTPDELMFNLSTNSKLKKIVDGEKTLKLINHTINNIDQELREFDWDCVVGGRGHLHCYHDENGMPRVKRIDPRFWGSSWVNNEDYSEAEYQFFIEFLTINQFKKETNGKLDEASIIKVLTQYAFPNMQATMVPLLNYYDNYDGLNYIPVMRFYFLSNDNRSHVFWKNQYGNTMMDERTAGYRAKNSKKQQDYTETSVTSVYGGSWVIDSDVVYDYGRRPIPRTKLVNTRLPIISWAPNMKNGRMVSMLAQMIEPLNMINVAHNKIKDILAKGRMGVYEFNLTALDAMQMGRGGKQWEPMEVVDFFMQTNVALGRQTTNQYGQGLGRIVQESSSGLTITDYINTITMQLQFLDKLTGSSVVENGQMPDRLAVGAMRANIAAGSDAMEYLVNGHLNVYQQAAHMLLLLTQETKRNKTQIKGLIPALGRGTTEFFEVPDELPYCEYGLQMERQPSDEEWAQFYMEVANDVEKGLLNSSDSAFIRTVTNLHEARVIMANRERINEAKAAKLRQQEQQFQDDQRQKASDNAMQMEMAILNQKRQNDLELATLQGKIQEYLQNSKLQMEAEIQGVAAMVEKQIKKQAGVDSIMKEAIRARAEGYKSDRQHSSKVMAANIQAQTAIATTAMKDNQKKKEEKKK